MKKDCFNAEQMKAHRQLKDNFTIKPKCEQDCPFCENPKIKELPKYAAGMDYAEYIFQLRDKINELVRAINDL